ncbi:hypothetical protein [Candidatus Nitrososphaera gargensis]|uniref:hypothetical protein n=1 Tax=Candidatus Nitrososphaera gargensis TaxID=497727 RepID=UPI0011E5708A|nr:hypothetical protein [Candidatus Nitrososphaera gargensis]
MLSRYLWWRSIDVAANDVRSVYHFSLVVTAYAIFDPEFSSALMSYSGPDLLPVDVYFTSRGMVIYH